MLLLALAACFGPGWDRVHREQLTGPYYLQAHDLHEAMFLIRDRQSEYTHIAGPGVMMAGYNNQYVVVAVDEPDFESPDKRRPREYFYIDRVINERDRTGTSGIVGPLTREAFDQHDQRLQLPDFTWANDGV